MAFARSPVHAKTACIERRLRRFSVRLRGGGGSPSGPMKSPAFTFAARQAYCLAYRSQREAPHDRARPCAAPSGCQSASKSDPGENSIGIDRRCTRRTAGYGCACTRRAANSAPCRATTISKSYLHAYVDGARLASDPKALLFQTYSRATGRLTGNPLPQANAYAMIQRRARAAEITTKIGNHTFRATGVTAYLKNGGTLERAAQIANHASTRTTQLYDRRAEEVTLDEVERIVV